jgi:hypothetical protein
MIIKDYNIYGLAESIIASGFSMDTGYLFDNFKENVNRLNDYLNSFSEEGNENSKKHFERSCWLGRKSGSSGEANFLSGIVVNFNIQYPLYLAKQLQRYHFLQIVSSSSTMHRITSMNFDKIDCDKIIAERFRELVNMHNLSMDKVQRDYLWNKIVKSCPSCVELHMMVSTNYLQLKTIYNQRKNHKLEEWKVFTKWISELPFFKDLVIG